jgi:hypothetical protein
MTDTELTVQPDELEPAARIPAVRLGELGFGLVRPACGSFGVALALDCRRRSEPTGGEIGGCLRTSVGGPAGGSKR